MTLLKSPVGITTVGFAETGPRLTRRVRWVCEGFAAVKVMRDFIDGRKGRAVPFWIPSMEDDMTILTAVVFSQTFNITAIGYAANMFPSLARRHIVIYRHIGQSRYYRRIVSAVDNGDGTETIGHDVLFGGTPSLPVQCWILRLCRLGEDRTRIEWVARNYAIAEFDAVEIPNEVPA